MITANFFDDGKGFEIKGHSDVNRSGPEIICASISSAAYLVANTITDIISAKAEIKVDDGYMFLRLNENNEEAERLIKGFRLHIDGLAKQYPKRVIGLKVKSKQNMEV
ncbi:MAG: ribosomal-processing cysteine protease Prp [Acutalibacteraceae bacterium]